MSQKGFEWAAWAEHVCRAAESPMESTFHLRSIRAVFELSRLSEVSFTSGYI